MTFVDPTRIDITTDPTLRRMRGTTFHGNVDFDVPYITRIDHNLWMGGVSDGLNLPNDIDHVVSLYPWCRYQIRRRIKSEHYITALDSINQDTTDITQWADLVNTLRKSGTVLVHCQAGLNRSALLVARALWIDSVEYRDGGQLVELLREKRSPACLCNTAFEAEVRSWKRLT